MRLCVTVSSERLGTLTAEMAGVAADRKTALVKLGTRRNGQEFGG